MARRWTLGLALLTSACTSDPSPVPIPPAPLGSAAAALAVGAPVDLLPASVPPPQVAPSVLGYGFGSGGERGYLATWADARSGEIQVYAGRYDLAFKARDGEGVRVSETPIDPSSPLTSAAARFDDGYIVVWWSSTEIRARVLGKDALPMGGSFLVASDVGTSGELAVGGRAWGSIVAIVWSDDSGPMVRAVRVAPGGKILDPSAVALGVGSMPSRPYRKEAGLESDLLGMDFRGPAGEWVRAAIDSTSGSAMSTMVTLPGSFMASSDQMTTFLDAKGNLGVRLPAGGYFFYAVSPLVAAPPVYDGYHRGLLTWVNPLGEIRGVRADVYSRLDDPGFAIRAGTFEHRHLTASSGAMGDQFAVVYSEQPPGAPEKSRVRASILTTSGLLGDACARDQDCESGSCAGVCCDRRCDGICESCSGAGLGVSEKPGICHPITGALSKCPRPDGCLVFVCDGKRTDACVPRSLTGEWCGGARRCDGDVLDNGGICASDGQCVESAAQRQSCVPYTCRADGCLTQCGIDADCARGHRCVDGRCVETSGCGCVLAGLARIELDVVLGSVASLAIVLAVRRRRRTPRPCSRP